MTLSLIPLFTPAAIAIFLLAFYIAFRVDAHRTRVRRRRAKREWPSALDEAEKKISE